MKLGKGKPVITVEGEFCACGEEVAAALADLLKMDCLSAEITDEAERLSGIPGKLLRRYESRRVREAYDLSATGEDTLRIPAEKHFLTAQIAACRELAKEGPCVLVDHHSNTALADLDDHVGIFVHADYETRLRTYAKRTRRIPEQAQRSFRRADREWTSCFRALSRDWGKASNYCLTVNSSRMAPEELAHSIVRYLETVTQKELVRPTSAQERSA